MRRRRCTSAPFAGAHRTATIRQQRTTRARERLAAACCLLPAHYSAQQVVIIALAGNLQHRRRDFAIAVVRRSLAARALALKTRACGIHLPALLFAIVVVRGRGGVDAELGPISQSARTHACVGTDIMRVRIFTAACATLRVLWESRNMLCVLCVCVAYSNCCYGVGN